MLLGCVILGWPYFPFDALLLDFTLHAVLMWSFAWGWCSADGVRSRWMNWSCQAVPSFSCRCSTGQKLCDCDVSLSLSSFHHSRAYVLALDIIISRFA